MFPLPVGFFPPLHLTKQEAQSFLQWGDSLLQQTIDAYHREQLDTQETRERKWKPIKQKHNLTVYRRRKIKDDSEFRYLCTGRIDGTLDKVVMGRYADNTADFRRISGVYREDIIDCAVLGVIKKRSQASPFYLSCFKWMTVESPGKGLVKNRDVCWYEQIGMTRDRNGKEIGYTLTESVDLPTCPLFQECVRAKFSICYLYKRNKSGGVNVYMRGKNIAGGKVIDWVADIKSAELWLRIELAMPVAHAVIATALVKAGKHTMRSRVMHEQCELCRTKASGMFLSSKECAVCHRTMCSSCVSKVRVLSFHDFRVPRYERFCRKCIRLIHQVDLRSPESVRNLIEGSTASLTESEGMENYDRSVTQKRAATDERGNDGQEHDNQNASRLTRSRSSSSGSFCMLQQPRISVIRNGQEFDKASYAQSQDRASGKQNQSPVYKTIEIPSISRVPAVPVILYVDPTSNGTCRREHCEADKRNHSLASSDDMNKKRRDSRSRKFLEADQGNAAPSQLIRNERKPLDSSLMTQIIQMNLIVEQSRQQLQDNMKLARQLRISRM